MVDLYPCGNFLGTVGLFLGMGTSATAHPSTLGVIVLVSCSVHVGGSAAIEARSESLGATAPLEHAVLESLDGGAETDNGQTARGRLLVACRSCEGDWGRWGYAQREFCRCRASDRGTSCIDSDDCAGECDWDGEKVIVIRQGTNASPDLGYAVGRCSEFIDVLGCRSPIERGARAKGPQPLNQSNMACTD